MKMLFTHVCAAVTVTLSFCISYGGVRCAAVARGEDVARRENQRKDSELSHTKWLPPSVVSCGRESPRPRLITESDFIQRDVYEEWELTGNRIVGGKGATIEEFPYMASLERYGMHMCSGCIITASWLVTAAFCFFDIKVADFVKDMNSYNVVAGTALITTIETRQCVVDQEIRNLSHLIFHPDFSLANPIPDLALVRITRPLSFNDQIQPARLPSSDADEPYKLVTGRRCYVAGWGLTSSEDLTKRSAVSLITGLCMVNGHLYTLPLLQKVTMPLLTYDDCLDKYPWAAILLEEDQHICTLSLEGKDACRGDAGGPLVCDGLVVALVSSGVGCGNSSNPTVYSRIDRHYNWILRTSDLWRVNVASSLSNVTESIALCLLALTIASICQA